MLPRRLALVAVAVLALGACTDRIPTAAAPAEDARLAKRGASSSSSYILLLRDRVRLSTLEAGVQAAGGTLAKTLPQAGLALVTARDARFAERAAKLSGVEAVVPDVRLLASAPP